MKEIVKDLIRHLQDNYSGDDTTYITHNLTAKPIKKNIESPKKTEPKPVLAETDLRNSILKASPNIRLKSDVLQDQWQDKDLQSPIIVLSYGESEKEKAFLQNLARAIDRTFLPAAVIPSSKFAVSDKTKLILSPPGVHKIPSYRMAPVTQEHFIGDVPVMLIQAPSQYLKNPHLKKQLWQALCTRLSS